MKIKRYMVTLCIITAVLLISLQIMQYHLQFSYYAETYESYLVYSENCRIPEFSIYDTSVKRFIQRHPTERKCSSDNIEDLTYIKRQTLILDLNKIDQYNVPLDHLECFYQSITRDTQTWGKVDKNCDRSSSLGDPNLITTEETNISYDGIFVYCNNGRNLSYSINNMFYKNVHHFIQPNKVLHKTEKYKNERKEIEKLNVILMGNDAVSRLNLIRHMPNTFNFLTENMDAIDLKGYNKVADNTYPNMMAKLSGKSLTEAAAENCPDKTLKVFDNCTFIWNKFSEKGYATVMAEDALHMATFVYIKNGFVKPPTDYYIHPSFRISEKMIGHNAGFSNFGNTCQGRKKSQEVLYDYIIEASQSLNNTPHFMFAHSAALTHDHLEYAQYGDNSSLYFLKQLDQSGTLNSTILFFFSDHGMRFGPIRKTHIGFIEERMPYMMIVFPKWFKNKYPIAWKVLKANQNELTCTFDIYQTLVDILHNNFDPKISRKYNGNGRSLFSKIAYDRSCDDCNIIAHYCSCQNSYEVPIDSTIKRIAKETVTFINNFFESYPQCSQLKLKKIISARMNYHWTASSNTKSPQPLNNHEGTKYKIKLETSPGGAQFEASVTIKKGVIKVGSYISRINRYNNQSHCVDVRDLKKFCYCKDLIKH